MWHGDPPTRGAPAGHNAAVRDDDVRFLPADDLPSLAMARRRTASILLGAGLGLALLIGVLYEVTLASGGYVVDATSGYVLAAVLVVYGAREYLRAVRRGARRYGPVGLGLVGAGLVASLVLSVTTVATSLERQTVTVGDCFAGEGAAAQEVPCWRPHDRRAAAVVVVRADCPDPDQAVLWDDWWVCLEPA